MSSSALSEWTWNEELRHCWGISSFSLTSWVLFPVNLLQKNTQPLMSIAVPNWVFVAVLGAGCLTQACGYGPVGCINSPPSLHRYCWWWSWKPDWQRDRGLPPPLWTWSGTLRENREGLVRIISWVENRQKMSVISRKEKYTVLWIIGGNAFKKRVFFRQMLMDELCPVSTSKRKAAWASTSAVSREPKPIC